MKKLFLNLGAIAGVALSALTLASCGNNAVTVKDANGEDMTITATADAEQVSKAAVAVAANAATNEEKYYAVGLKASASASGKASFMGMSVEASGSINAEQRFSIGKDTTYTDYSNYDEYTEAQITAAQNELKNNIKAEGKLSIDASLKGKYEFDEDSIRSMYEGMGLDTTAIDAIISEAKAEMTTSEETNESIKAELKDFLYEGNMYGEIEANATSMFAGALSNLIDGESKEDGSISGTAYVYNSESIFDEESPEICTYLNMYKNNTLAELLASMGIDLAAYGIIPSTTTTTDEISTSTVDFYDSAIFAAIKNVVEQYGIEISAVKNDVVTFKLSANGKVINNAFNAVSQFAFDQSIKFNSLIDTTTTTVTSLFDDDTVYATAEISFNVKTGLPTSCKVASDKIAEISTAVMGFASNMSSELALVSAATVSEGKVEASLEFSYNDAVSLSYTKDSSKTYVDTNDNRLR